MTIVDKLKQLSEQTADTLASIIKIVLKSRPVGCAMRVAQDAEIVLLGNGPSLRSTIDHQSAWLLGKDKLAVNFAANSMDFVVLKPKYYVLADPHFFNGMAEDSNVVSLWGSLSEVSWPMTLFVPVSEIEQSRMRIKNENIVVKGFNMTPVEGFEKFRNFIYGKGLGMPRPRNVLIPAMMLAIREGYGKIYVAGADHNWSKTLWVDDENHVVTRQPHFYEDNENEHKRVADTYSTIRLHEVYMSFAIAFRSYFLVRDYAVSRDVKIMNITPGSFIDAFPRFIPSENKEK